MLDWTRPLLVTLCLAAASALTACGAPSLHGIATPERTTDDPRLAGTWTDDDLVLDVRRTKPGRYTVQATLTGGLGSKGETLALEARLVELGGEQFADIRVADHAQLADDYGAFVIYPHHVIKIRRRRNTLTLWALDADEIAEIAASDPALSATGAADDLLLTSSTRELQAFVTKHARHRKVFEKFTRLRKVEPTP